ncbi:hypothetical protein DVH24_008020 [Malus domestica]|uniref:Uncharacterized protein n=1 Tax=Malus domestica TaxID=3750 RepID=A0A498JIZ6_MALDO|nr:hypothetical protein DVH24_008020 [Malus domestica]
MDCAGGSYQVGDNISVVGSRSLAQLGSGFVPYCHVMDGSFGPACRVSPFGSTWLSMCGSPTYELLIGSHMRGRVEMSHIGQYQ